MRRLRQVRRRVGMETMHHSSCAAMITSRLDYCNSVLAGLPRLHSTHCRGCRILQHGLYSMLAITNTSHRTFSNCTGYQYVHECMFKLWTLMHAIHNKRCPAYIADVMQPVGVASTQTGLRSADSSNYSLPRLESALFLTRVRPPGTNYPKASASCERHLSNTN